MMELDKNMLHKICVFWIFVHQLPPGELLVVTNFHLVLRYVHNQVCRRNDKDLII